MAKQYRLGAGTRLVNAVFRVMTRLGVGRSDRHILTVRGRKTGRPYAIPVDVMAEDGQRWLVSAYGVASWVRNARAAGQVSLTRGRRTETLKVSELEPHAAVPVLRKYLREVPVVRPYFDVAADSPDHMLVHAAREHPVFRLTQ